MEKENNTGRVNACFSASRTETAENLCLYYNHRFSYYLSYGAVDQYAKGSYRCSNDTVYLNSKAIRSFTVAARKTETIPNGKIKLLFTNPGKHAGYISWAAGDASYIYVDALKKSGNHYFTVIERPASSSIALQHTLYEKMPVDYVLDKSKNEFSIGISDSLGSIAFDNEPFVWEGNKLRSADPEKPKVFTMAASAPLSYDEIHWDSNEPKPSREAFSAWSLQQELLFRKSEETALALEAAKEQALKNEMLRHFETSWTAALQKARQDTVAIVLLLGVNSIDKRADSSQPSSTDNRKTALDYYNAFSNDGYEENAIKMPVFYQPSEADTALLGKMRIDLLPTVAILTPENNILFKMEGVLPGASRLKDIYSQLMKARENEKADTVIIAFNTAVKDSSFLVKMIGFIENTKADALPVYTAAGISIKNLLDSLVEKHTKASIYNKGLYDFVAKKYFPDRWMSDYYTSGNSQPQSPALLYLLQHFGNRQKDVSPANRSRNDSLVMNTYLNLSSAISMAFYSAANDVSLYTRLLAMSRQLINGNTPYADFFSSIVYLEKAQGLSKFGSTMAAGYETDLQDFLVKYAGGTNVNTATVDAEARKMFISILQDSNQVFLDTYFMNNASEAGYTRTYRTVIGHVITLQAVSTMTKTGDSLLSRGILQKPTVMKQLALAADMSALPNHYPLKRNYAYALYEMGDAAKAIPLLQEVIKIMEEKDNSYMAGTDRVKQAKEMLQKMKTGKKLNARIADLVTY